MASIRVLAYDGVDWQVAGPSIASFNSSRGTPKLDQMSTKVDLRTSASAEVSGYENEIIQVM